MNQLGIWSTSYRCYRVLFRVPGGGTKGFGGGTRLGKPNNSGLGKIGVHLRED